MINLKDVVAGIIGSEAPSPEELVDVEKYGRPDEGERFVEEAPRPLLEDAPARRRRSERDEMAEAVRRSVLARLTGAAGPESRRRFAVQPAGLPEILPLVARRFMLCAGGNRGEFSLVWVDDPGSCERFHAAQSGAGLWHLGRLRLAVAVRRCPSLLSPEELERLEVDSPEGRFRSVLAGARRKALAGGRKGRAPVEAGDSAAWRGEG